MFLLDRISSEHRRCYVNASMHAILIVVGTPCDGTSGPDAGWGVILTEASHEFGALRLLLGRGAEGRPRLHQPAPLLQQVAPAIGCFGPVLDRVSKRGLDDFVVERRALGCPVAEAGAKPVNCATPTLELLG